MDVEWEGDCLGGGGRTVSICSVAIDRLGLRDGGATVEVLGWGGEIGGVDAEMLCLLSGGE